MRPGARCGSALLRRSREGDVCSPVPRPRRAVASSPLCCFCLEIAGSSKSRAVSILVNSHSCSARSSGRRSASSRRFTNCRFFVSSLAMIIDVAPPVLVVNLVLRTDVAWHRARASSLPRYCFRSRLRARCVQLEPLSRFSTFVRASNAFRVCRWKKRCTPRLVARKHAFPAHALGC